MQNYHGGGGDQKFSQAPPDYGFNAPQNNKQDFDQTFKIQKPRWNDLWAGIAVRQSHLSTMHS